MRPPGTRVIAVIPAAGSGTRMGCAVPKQYLSLHGKPMLWHSAASLLAHEGIDRVVVTLDEGDPYWSSLGLEQSLAACTLLRCGGDSRARTVLNTLRAIEGAVQAADWILVHDAARPCLDRSALDRLFHAVLPDDVGGLLAIPVRDTLKCALPDGRVAHTQSRERLWQAQTPQMFRYGLLKGALEGADLSQVTDESSAVEALGHHPVLVTGSARNLKITYPEDVALAEQFLQP